MTAPDYEMLRTWLDRPRARCADIEELLHPHAPPADADWPAPVEDAQIDHLFRRLPVRVAVMCGAVAVELVLPIWRAFVVDEEITDEWAEMPLAAMLDVDGGWHPLPLPIREAWSERVHVAQIAARRLADGHFEVFLPAGARPTHFVRVPQPEAGPGRAAALVAQAVVAILDDTSETASEAVRLAVAANSEWRLRGPLTVLDSLHAMLTMQSAFLQRWWARCRCRLAVAKIESLVFHTP